MTRFLITIFLLCSTLCNDQYHGETPWSSCYGENASCDKYGCSDIIVKTSKSSPVVAIVKKRGRVIKHAYISANRSYTFQVPDGTYQVFFYYGENWNKYKKLNTSECNYVFGRFTSDESVQKDDPVYLSNKSVTYTLTQITNGNFQTKSSNLNEAL